MNGTAPGVLLLLAVLPAAAAPVNAPHVQAELVAERTAFLPGTNTVALRLSPERGWHTYWRNPGDSGTATSLAWTLPAGWTAGDIQWPAPSTERIGELVNYGYAGETLHLVDLQAPAASVGREATVQATARWLVCKDVCIPGSAELALTLPVRADAPPDPGWSALFAQTRAQLPRTPPLPGMFAADAGTLRLRVDAPGSGAVEFFPYANDLVNHGAPQHAQREGETVVVQQALSSYFTAAPAAVEGVLVLQDATRTAWEVRALPGVVPATAHPVVSAEPGGAASPGAATALLFALLGGLILNLMPCVFPLLSIKAISLLEAQGAQRSQQRRHAIAYTAGVVGACVLAAATILGLRAGGQALGWGFQLQSPVFVAVLVYLLFAMGLSLSGLVQLGTRLMGVGQSLAVRGGYAGSFFTGVLAVVVASPCTAPFMGSALGFALTQPAALSLLVFATLGLGLALPFLAIAFVPALGAWLPRPGAWMETFKQAMAFPLYLSAIWLLWVLGRQSSMDAVALVLGGVAAIAFACWLAARAGVAARVLRWAALAAAMAVLAAPALRAPAPPPATGASDWQPWSEERVAQLRAQGRPVFVNFTADWCITCKVNERVALGTDEVRNAFARHGVALLEGDWTRSDPAITAALQRFGRPGVPLYVLYLPGAEPRLLPQLLTPRMLLDALAPLPEKPA
ncbi:MAG TPA: thioredoxin family protein [Candidatus Binatia bacterium]|nr:thioredoxin family protein [Candidatus Binatia bacterium]